MNHLKLDSNLRNTGIPIIEVLADFTIVYVPYSQVEDENPTGASPEHIAQAEQIKADFLVYIASPEYLAGEEASRVANLTDTHAKPQVAPDFIVCSPKIKPNRAEAFQEAKDEALKPAKSIAKLALTLPTLIAHLEELEARVKVLEKR